MQNCTIVTVAVGWGRGVCFLSCCCCCFFSFKTFFALIYLKAATSFFFSSSLSFLINPTVHVSDLSYLQQHKHCTVMRLKVPSCCAGPQRGPVHVHPAAPHGLPRRRSADTDHVWWPLQLPAASGTRCAQPGSGLWSHSQVKWQMEVLGTPEMFTQDYGLIVR